MREIFSVYEMFTKIEKKYIFEIVDLLMNVKIEKTYIFEIVDLLSRRLYVDSP